MPLNLNLQFHVSYESLWQDSILLTKFKWTALTKGQAHKLLGSFLFPTGHDSAVWSAFANFFALPYYLLTHYGKASVTLNTFKVLALKTNKQKKLRLYLLEWDTGYFWLSECGCIVSQWKKCHVTVSFHKCSLSHNSPLPPSFFSFLPWDTHTHTEKLRRTRTQKYTRAHSSLVHPLLCIQMASERRSFLAKSPLPFFSKSSSHKRSSSSHNASSH